MYTESVVMYRDVSEYMVLYRSVWLCMECMVMYTGVW